jgi:outer membrane lipoprotein-sorting protein
MRLDFDFEYDVTNQSEEGGVITLELAAKNETVTYEKLVMRVDKKTLFPNAIDCYAGGIKLKTIRYLDPKDFGDGVKRPSVLETTSDLQRGYKSVMVFGKIKKRPLSDAVFTIDNIAKVGELRE